MASRRTLASSFSAVPVRIHRDAISASTGGAIQLSALAAAVKRPMRSSGSAA